jgi:hypothetical protein
MYARHVHLLCLSLCLVALGCSDTGLVDVDPGSAAIEAGPGADALQKNTVKYVPLDVRGTLALTTDPRAELGLVCVGAETELFARADGWSRFLGKVVGWKHGCVDLSTGQGQRWLTLEVAANGDSILTFGVCNATSATDFVCEGEVVSGTGRFENTSTPPGEPIQVEGKTYGTTGEFHYWGRISTVGSSG